MEVDLDTETSHEPASSQESESSDAESTVSAAPPEEEHTIHPPNRPVFAIGVAGPRSRRVAPAKRGLKKTKPSTGRFQWPSFPLSRFKYYDLMTYFRLAGFPKSSVQAVLHFQKLIAPPTHELLRPMPCEEIARLRDAFQENIHARWAFRKLLLAWIYRRCKVVNEEDPITLEPIRQPIRVYHLKTRAIYQFEARCLARNWKINLLHHDGVFPEPRVPSNPLTNEPMNILQVHNIYRALRPLGHLDWVLDSYGTCQYDATRWQKKFSAPLRLESLHRVMSDQDSFDRFDMLMDFTELQYDYHGSDFPRSIFRWIFREHQAEIYEKEWIRACRKFYSEKYMLTDQTEIDELEIRTSNSLEHLIKIPPKVRNAYRKYLNRIQELNGGGLIQNRVIVIRGPRNSIIPAGGQ